MRTREEIEMLLLEPLDPIKVKKRDVYDYVEAWYVIDQLNHVFGFFGWDRMTTNLICVQADKNSNQKDRVAYTAQCVLTVRIGEQTVIRYGVGFGNGFDNDPGKAHESAIKEAESDAMKRAASTLGYRFGLALYDKNKEHVQSQPRELTMAEAKKIAIEKAKSYAKDWGITTTEYANGVKFFAKIEGVKFFEFVLEARNENVQNKEQFLEYAESKVGFNPLFDDGATSGQGEG